jgi:hypothetical protein
MNLLTIFLFKKRVLPILFLPVIILQVTYHNTNESRYLFQPGTPIAIENFLTIDDNCYDLGIMGQVFSEGDPIQNIIVKLSGSYGDEDILIYGITGGEPSLGPSGYKITLIGLDDQLEEQNNELFIQLINSSGLPISAILPIKITGNCNQNAIIINFIDVSRENDQLLPIIIK